MKVKTDQAIILNREKITQKIAQFWNQISEGWRVIWGPHIHHGYYENEESITPLAAQEKLIDKLTGMLSIKAGSAILDVGCGMGGSSLYLAKKYDAKVIGITLSSKQVDIATKQARDSNIKHVQFKVEDAQSMKSFSDHSFDIVWSLESCEQFFDKELFIKKAFRVLKPGGQFMLATWCSSHDEYEGQDAKKYQKLCHAFDLPYMPTIENYKILLEKNGFVISDIQDWTEQVKQSWEIGVSLVGAYSFFQLLKMGGWRGLIFAKQVKLMRDAFREQRLKYGVFLVTKP